jgi:hypothetical protein
MRPRKAFENLQRVKRKRLKEMPQWPELKAINTKVEFLPNQDKLECALLHFGINGQDVCPIS